MSKKYEHLLSPYKIGNVIFRNRMTSGPNDVHFLQGPENYITDAMISWLANMARNGAAWVTYTRDPVPSGYKIDNLRTMYEGTKEMVNMPTWMTVKPEPVMTNKAHMTLSDVSDGNVQHYISQMTENIHFYGSKISAIEMRSAPPGYDVSAGIPGINGKNVTCAPYVYGNEDSLGENIVVIGGGEVGVETALHLAEKGHKTMVLEITNTLAADATPVHYYTVLQAYWENEKNFSYATNATCNGITAGNVTYLDANVKDREVKADSVVIAVGMKAKNELAMKFHGAGERLYMIGDCNKAGNVQKVMRSAFATASML